MNTLNQENTGALTSNFSEKEIISLIDQAIIGKIEIKFMNQKSNTFESLTFGELALLKSVGKKGFSIIRSHNLQWNDLWVDIIKGKELISKIPMGCSDAVLSYRTKFIDIQRLTIEKYWISLDEETRPKKNDIMKWLMTEHGLLKSEADIIDKMCRPDQYRNGGNIPRKKSKGKPL